MKCPGVIVNKHTDGAAWLPDEDAALIAGGKAGGAYLESIGKTDLTVLTKVEWDTFLRTIEAARSQALRDAIPF